MVITVPKNFSENATTLMDAVPKKMELDYKTNPGTNYIAMKMSETALEKSRLRLLKRSQRPMPKQSLIRFPRRVTV